MIYLSTVTPVYRGSEFLEKLVYEIAKVKEELEGINAPFRILESVFVDDGSIDGSDLVLEKLSKTYSWLVVITLSKNFGQHPATTAGILHSSGDWIVTLDEDLQHHPKFILTLLKEAVFTNSDVVYANPEQSVHESRFRDYSSKKFKVLISKITRNPAVVMFNSFRLMRGSIARATAAISIDQTYFDIALGWFTTRISQISFPLKDDRFINSKISGYSLVKLISHARRLVQSSELKILRIGTILGLSATIFGIIFVIFVIFIKVFYPELITAQGWASVIILVSILGGVNAFLIGLVLEHISILLMQSHGKPKFFEVNRKEDSIILKWFKLIDSK
ncbi:glycosyltransferase [Algoriphagus yeomjeoni]|uniref:Glycosyltransferase involved in cell wall biosynthesis n=1 Tax=Algoriphagus yeomjeoni TaxID=291403 RepID=A0A327P002_9BACT|nr:glycosyltransferase [Algoriphagus yeomjeoni]RAI85578.1 glycosyltransferase involved in cell wall biosynthesis [Algoriphagus yeomjeoni]